MLAFARAVAERLASRHGLQALAPLGQGGAAALGGDARLAKEAAAVADDLAGNRGRSAVLVGSGQPPAVHALAAALNAALGNLGKTVSFAAPPVDGPPPAPPRWRRWPARSRPARWTPWW